MSVRVAQEQTLFCEQEWDLAVSPKSIMMAMDSVRVAGKVLWFRSKVIAFFPSTLVSCRQRVVLLLLLFWKVELGGPAETNWQWHSIVIGCVFRFYVCRTG
jgi:hypothetical protein